MAKNKSEFDSPWKDILDLYFEEFIALCWPSKYDEIDWSKGYKMRDKELSKIYRTSKTGKKVADKLVEVYLKNGATDYIFLHIEVEKAPKACLPERMFTYNTRLRDVHKQPIASLAILLDSNPHFRPDTYREERWGTSIEMRFPIIKIVDYSNRIEELEASNNPFAQVILAQLAAMEKEGASDKLNTKLRLMKNLYKKGWKKADLLALLKFIDWIMALPPELELQCTEATEKMEEELKMKYVTSFERIGIQRGMEKGLAKGIEKGKILGESELLVFQLNSKFQTIPENYLAKIKNANTDSLMAWAKKLLFAPKIEDVFEDENTLVTP